MVVENQSSNSRSFAIRVFATFLPMACIGTLLHEGGHIAAARFLGYGTTLHFGSMSWFPDSGPLGDVSYEAHSAWISLGGPLANMGLGTLGLLYLARLSKRGPVELRGQGLLAVLLALFWSRQVFNFCMLTYYAISGRDWSLSDEVRLAHDLGWPPASISLLTALVASLALVRTVLHVKKDQRLPLILCGTAGSLVGFALWYGALGPLVLP